MPAETPTEAGHSTCQRVDEHTRRLLHEGTPVKIPVGWRENAKDTALTLLHLQKLMGERGFTKAKPPKKKILLLIRVQLS